MTKSEPADINMEPEQSTVLPAIFEPGAGEISESPPKKRGRKPGNGSGASGNGESQGAGALTLKDRLSRLTFAGAAKLLGPEGKNLLRSHAAMRFVSNGPEEIAFPSDDEFRIKFDGAEVNIFLSPDGLVDFGCSECLTGRFSGCEHAAAAFSFILEEKTALGLAAPPPERVPLEMLGESELVERAVSERRERVISDSLRVSDAPKGAVWGNYRVNNPKTGKSYTVTVRGWEKGKIVCECPDFRVNTLGLCKHTLAVEDYLKKKRLNLQNLPPWEPEAVEVFLDYGRRPLEVKVAAPSALLREDLESAGAISPFLKGAVDDLRGLLRCLSLFAKRDVPFFIFPDAIEHMELRLHRERMAKITAEIRSDPASHPLRKTLLNVELLPYQLDGVAFAAGAGRAIIADEMGLGKTIQGVGLAEFLARKADVKRVLVVCPASLKSQWEEEIKRFCGRSVIQILGGAAARRLQYQGDSFFTICNYEQIPRDKAHVGKKKWDLLILDEAQRIKNWETKAHRAVADLKSRHLLILTGTPLENSLGELYTLVKLVDREVLGPAFRFLNAHKQTDDRGKLLAWRGLNEVKAAMAPVFLRRTRATVMKELPPRQVEIIKIPPTQEQLEIHNYHLKAVRRIVGKPYLTEMDFLRLQKHLLMCRLAANSTFLADKAEPGFSSKLAELWELLTRLRGEEDRKIIVFTEWTTMLNLVERQLGEWGEKWARLDGSVPQQKRKFLVKAFSQDPEVRFFLTTNAGSTGLNLQAADTVVNLDLPWNPALLEQRIGRAHRIGQKKVVQAFLLVTANTIEERLLSLLGAKSELALACLDLESGVDFVEMTSGIDALKNRLEILLGRKPDQPPEPEAEAEAEAGGEGESSSAGRSSAKKEKISEAGGKLLTAFFDFLGELVPAGEAEAPADAPQMELPGGEGLPAEEKKEKASPLDALGEIFKNSLDKDGEGRPRLTLTLPDEDVIRKAAGVLKGILGKFF
ncbi:MAG: DEAD/DEAH box helicase [Deltaproteobacteria bacterium]|jgi:superfamily II DNA or RNA helicase|nr:DEAD/DEAH box helicase [Deltaproteobacteria bacterium]